MSNQQQTTRDVVVKKPILVPRNQMDLETIMLEGLCPICNSQVIAKRVYGSEKFQKKAESYFPYTDLEMHPRVNTRFSFVEMECLHAVWTINDIWILEPNEDLGENDVTDSIEEM